MKAFLGVVGFVAFVAALMVVARSLAPDARKTAAKPAAPVVAPPPVEREEPVVDDRAEDGPGDGPAPLLPDLDVVKDGKVLKLAGKRPRPLLLHLWATWCGPCRAELPSILAFGQKGLAEVLAVSVDDEWPSVTSYFQGKIPPEVAWDQKIALERALGVQNIPTTFLVDTDGRVLQRWTGAQEWDDPVMLREVTTVLVNAGRTR